MLNRNDIAPVPPSIIETAKSDTNNEVRAAACTIMGAFPDEDSIRFLFQMISGSDKNLVSDAAFEALATTTYPEIDNVILEYLAGTNPNPRMTACRLAGERHLTAAEPLLWIASKDVQRSEVVTFAFTSLGRLVNKEGFSQLLDVYLDKEKANDAMKVSVLNGIKTACRLTSNRNDYVKMITEKLPPELASLQLELLTLVGGSDALKRIAELAKTTEQDKIRDEATKYLGEWTEVDAASVLLDLSKSLKEDKYKIRTFRGFLRVIRQFDLPKEEKRKLCEQALEIAPRDEEKKLAQDVLSKL
jgi:aminopeptidase N